MSGLTRSTSDAITFRQAGLDVFAPTPTLCQHSAPSSDCTKFLLSRLSRTTHLLVTVSPGSFRDPVMEQYYKFLQEAKNLIWLAYLSSTSVYGEHGGAWVNELTVPRSPRSRGTARLQAEQAWTQFARDHSSKPQLFIMRLAGIYGPGRSMIESLLNRPGEAMRLDSTESKLTSRVHINDIISALVTVARCESVGGIYNVADDIPACRLDVSNYARQLILSGAAGNMSLHRFQIACLQRPEYPSARVSSLRDTERTSKRVSNLKLRENILSSLEFPSYREGLFDIATAIRRLCGD